MCDCIHNFEKTFIEKQSLTDHRNNPLKVTKASITSAGMMFIDNSIQTQMTGEIELTVEGKKKPVKKMLAFSHCPFCGEKYKKTETE